VCVCVNVWVGGWVSGVCGLCVHCEKVSLSHSLCVCVMRCGVVGYACVCVSVSVGMHASMCRWVGIGYV